MKTWTQKDEALLERLREKGTPPAEIAERLGRTSSAVSQHAMGAMGLRRLRAQKRFWADSDTEELHKLFPTTSITDIAEQLGRTPQSVRDKAKNEGLYKRDYPL
tara:strand:+ start:36452 stop:36763 length:312 start_codon:yes stop_codon:yes gene_type:complete